MEQILEKASGMDMAIAELTKDINATCSAVNAVQIGLRRIDLMNCEPRAAEQVAHQAKAKFFSKGTSYSELAQECFRSAEAQEPVDEATCQIHSLPEQPVAGNDYLLKASHGCDVRRCRISLHDELVAGDQNILQVLLEAAQELQLYSCSCQHLRSI